MISCIRFHYQHLLNRVIEQLRWKKQGIFLYGCLAFIGIGILIRLLCHLKIIEGKIPLIS
jgi:hypothetical protein